MNYDDMSDFEINLAASSYVDFGELIVNHNTENETVYLCEKDGFFFEVVPISHFNPCNNPSDAWPIIVENEISINPHGSKWMVNNFNPSNVGDFKVQTCHYDKNPLRAAMICFLKMKDAEKQ